MHASLGRVAIARRHQGRRAVAEHERDATVVGADRAAPDPHEVATRRQRVEVGLAVAEHPRGEHVALQDRGRDRDPLQACERLGQGVAAGGGAIEALPRRQEPSERGGVDGLDLAPQGRERAPADPPEHVDVAPLPLDAARAELAVDDPAVRGERLEGGAHRARIRAEPTGRRLGR